MFKKVQSLLILFLLLSIAASSGCGGRSEADPIPAEAATPTSPTVPPAAAATDPPPTQAPSPTSISPTERPTAASPPATEAPTPTPTPTAIEPATIEDLMGIHAPEATEVKKYVVILADFPDVERKIDIKKLTERMVGFVENYFSEASFGKLELKGHMTKRYMLPDPVSAYKISPHNLEVDRNKVLKLVTDAVNSADAEVQFGEDLMVMIALGATPAEYGMIGYSAVPGMLEFKSDDPITTRSGEVIRNANPEAPILNDAAYDIGKNAVFIDAENGGAVVLLKENGLVYEFMITTPDQTTNQQE